MKKFAKILTVVMSILVLLTITTNVMAATTANISPSNITGTTNANLEGITNIGNSIVAIITTIGIVVSVIVLIVLGIKYMLGSAEEKAEYKKTLLPYVIGAGLVFAASTIATIIFNFMQSV